MRAVIADVFARHMEGENPENIEMMFRRAYSSGFTQRPDLTVMGAFPGLEIACWDILGKARGRPVWALLGGLMNERLRSYACLYPEPGQDPDGFWFDPAGPCTLRGGHQPARSDFARSAEFCRAIRAAVGDGADLLFGTHGQFSVPGAIRLGRALEPHDPLWYEEPVPPDMLPEFAEVARHVRVPLATGERLTTRAEFGTLLRLGGVRILQPALGRAGGIREARKIAAMAEVFGAEIAPHLNAGPIEWAANIQLAAAIPNLLLVETIQTGGAFHLAPIRNAIRWEDGFIETPRAPGLGIEVDEELIRANPYSGQSLHLEMQEAPCSYREPNRFEGGAPARWA